MSPNRGHETRQSYSPIRQGTKLNLKTAAR